MKGQKSGRTGYREITTKGIVIPAEWDEKGNPTVIAVATHEEQEYLIDKNDEKSDELLEILHQEIELTGVLGKKVKNRRTITVKKYFIRSSE
ncbi:hypothetical protein [Desulfonema magnum]|nr:hypothetical protein [Desulfonema magnum]